MVDISSIFGFVCVSALTLAEFSVAETTFGDTDKEAWGANFGWVSFRHDRPASPAGISVHESHLSGFAYSSNTGWIDFGKALPTNGHTYSNEGTDHGVNHDGAGNLSGYAWSANTGWVNFSWPEPTDPNRPRISLETGAFSGYAWSPNLGWINLSAALLKTQFINRTDNDLDGIADTWELRNFTSLRSANMTSDRDKDGVSDLAEYRAGTDPNSSADFLKIISQTFGETLTQTTIEFSSTPTRRYRIEFSDDLAEPWTDSPLGEFRPGTGASTTRTIGYPGNPKKFFRAVAILPLTP